MLKGEWGFDGVAMSDWFGTQSTEEALAGGLDLEDAGPASHRGAKLIEVYRAGKVSDSALREAALRMLRLIDRAGGSNPRRSRPSAPTTSRRSAL